VLLQLLLQISIPRNQRHGAAWAAMMIAPVARAKNSSIAMGLMFEINSGLI
jgi:hypothetical protein